MFYPEEFNQRLRQPEDRAQVVLNELITDGRVVLSPDIDGNERYELATDGHAHAGATARQHGHARYSTRALDGFLARVEEINANPLAEWGARKLVLFGSFLDPNIERVGDVDLAVEMVPLHQLTKEQFDAVMRRWIHGRRRVQPRAHAAVRGDAVPQEQKSVLRLLELDGEHVVSTGQIDHTRR